MRVHTEQDLRLATTFGSVMQLAAGEERNLEGEFLRLALSLGATSVEQRSKPQPIPTPAVEPTSSREDLVRVAIEELITRNDPRAFTSLGVPRVSEVAVILGDEVTKAEVDAVFRKMTD